MTTMTFASCVCVGLEIYALYAYYMSSSFLPSSRFTSAFVLLLFPLLIVLCSDVIAVVHNTHSSVCLSRGSNDRGGRAGS